MNKLECDVQIAQQFLAHFEGRITFQTFDDKGKDRTLTQVLHGSSDGDCEKILQRLTKGNAKGAGVFFSVNQTDGKGRKKENHTQVRAFFVELDSEKDGRTSPTELLAGASLEPHIVVQSSPGNYHAYWLCDDCELGEFEELQKKLHFLFEVDKGVYNLDRVLRVPGFYHQKTNTPHLVKLVSSESFIPYSKIQIEKFVADSAEKKGIDPNQIESAHGFEDEFDREYLLEEGAEQGENRNLQMYKYACSLRAKRVAASEAIVLMQALNTKFKPPLSESELKQRLKSAWRHDEGCEDDEFEDDEDEVVEVSEEHESSCVDKDGQEKSEKNKKLGDKPVKGAKTKKKKKQKRVRKVDATVEDHLALITERFGELRRDIFSNDLFYYNKTLKDWKPIANKEDAMKGYATKVMESAPFKYKVSTFKWLLEDHVDSLKPRLIIDIPEWDGVDRLAEMAAKVELEEDCIFFPEDFEMILKEWMGRMFRRLENPRVQNRVLVLKGGQGIGKDTWVDNLLNGLGRFAPELSGDLESKDTLITLSNTVALRVAEFDKTARVSVSVLKSIITTPFVYVRQPYGRRADNYPCRCSFIATANVDDLLRDYTGNRRYSVFPVERIRWDYPTDDDYQMQVLSQAKSLAKEQFEAEATHWARMTEYIAQMTPDNPSDLVLEAWKHVIEHELAEVLGSLQTVNNIQSRGFFSNPEVGPVIDRVARICDLKPKQVRTYLRTLKINKFVKVAGKTMRVYEINSGGVPVTEEEYLL